MSSLQAHFFPVGVKNVFVSSVSIAASCLFRPFFKNIIHNGKQTTEENHQRRLLNFR